MLTPDTFSQRQNGMFETLLKTVSQIPAIAVCRERRLSDAQSTLQSARSRKAFSLPH